MEKKYLSDKGVVNPEEIQYGKLNIIDAPCGSGKTSFIENVLWKESYWGRLLYLTDTKNGLEAFKRRGELKEYKGVQYYSHEGITAMTYAGFATFCKYQWADWTWNDEDSLIVCDELQSAIKWARIIQKDEYGVIIRKENPHKTALAELHKRIDIGARVVAISATTFAIREEFKDKCIDVPIHADLIKYEVKHKIKYQNIQNIINELPADKKGLIYVPHVSNMIDLAERLEARSIKCAAIWSIANNDYKMCDDDLRTRKSILEDERIPDDIQVVFINAASETGINIKSNVDYVVVNSIDEDTVIQVIGRVRHDIDTVYYLDRERTDGLHYISQDKISKWLAMPLTVSDKNKICAELDFRDKRGRLVGWTTIKKSLKYFGYEVTEKKSGSERFTIIS